MRRKPLGCLLHCLQEMATCSAHARDFGGGGGWNKASVSDCLPLAAPIGLSPLLIPTLCGPERVLVVSTEPPHDLSCLTTPGVGRPGDELLPVPLTMRGGGGHKASVLGCLPLAAPIGLSPLLILTLCGPERVLVVSTEPPDDLSCLTTPGVGRPRDGAVAGAGDQVHPDAHPESVRGFADSSTDLCALGCASAGEPCSDH